MTSGALQKCSHSQAPERWQVLPPRQLVHVLKVVISRVSERCCWQLRHKRLTNAGCRLQGSCCTCIMVAVSGTIVAVLAVTDPLKPEARGVVAALARRGLAVHLVTGDNWRTARAIAEQLAIVNVCAECLPGAKADKIKVCSLHTPFLC